MNQERHPDASWFCSSKSTAMKGEVIAALSVLETGPEGEVPTIPSSAYMWFSESSHQICCPCCELTTDKQQTVWGSPLPPGLLSTPDTWSIIFSCTWNGVSGKCNWIHWAQTPQRENRPREIHLVSYLYSALSLTSIFPHMLPLFFLFAFHSLNSPLWQACYLLDTVLGIEVYELVCR